jgi:hypothetical protein
LLGEEVAHVLRAVRPLSANGPIQTALKTVELPGKARGETKPGLDAPPAPFVITVGRVGNFALVGLGGEVFNEIGWAIKAASPFPHTFVFTHCNGAAGYVPTRASYSEGGYEVQSSAFAPGAEERLLEQTTRMLQELWKGRN